ncbi:hypothetical protein ONS95_008553 [Cadophora gregata]|uniref:uncharacterized protein n=1 Tax=Cadophora gregata TaxID=51156 RepID=UPI0026DD65B2|nr:uncharacterized protein ONS95_008553 [Cadophora gregata]KAK0100215.1 hypothetical protein ONS95_008553 [Cadophora gregata]KAK0114835.1 hypothetical protein ONS96_013318 [Cadophora gregata f. sp. sojae]
MKALLLGATGNLGSRLVPALLAHNHQVCVFARNPQKLNDLLPSSVISKLQIIQGDATSETAATSALTVSDAEVLVTAAGAAPLLAWPKSNVMEIDSAIVASLEVTGTKRRIRSWFLAGMLLLDLPGSGGSRKLFDYLPLYPNDVHKIPLLEQSKNIRWSCICPAKMSAFSKKVLSAEEHF